MDFTRRQFLAISSATAAAFVLGPKSFAGVGGADAGPLSDFAKDGVYDFRGHGFFLIRKDSRLFAQTAYCTHRRCRVAPADDGGFHCKCHGSMFTQDGKVTHGPAKADLPRNQIALDDNNHVRVDTFVIFKPGEFEKDGAFLQLR